VRTRGGAAIRTECAGTGGRGQGRSGARARVSQYDRRLRTSRYSKVTARSPHPHTLAVSANHVWPDLGWAAAATRPREALSECYTYGTQPPLAQLIIALIIALITAPPASCFSELSGNYLGATWQLPGSSLDTARASQPAPHILPPHSCRSVPCET
jgi:hypothetical protein